MNANSVTNLASCLQELCLSFLSMEQYANGAANVCRLWSRYVGIHGSWIEYRMGDNLLLPKNHPWRVKSTASFLYKHERRFFSVLKIFECPVFRDFGSYTHKFDLGNSSLRNMKKCIMSFQTYNEHYVELKNVPKSMIQLQTFGRIDNIEPSEQFITVYASIEDIMNGHCSFLNKCVNVKILIISGYVGPLTQDVEFDQWVNYNFVINKWPWIRNLTILLFGSLYKDWTKNLTQVINGELYKIQIFTADGPRTF